MHIASDDALPVNRLLLVDSPKLYSHIRSNVPELRVDELSWTEFAKGKTVKSATLMVAPDKLPATAVLDTAHNRLRCIFVRGCRSHEVGAKFVGELKKKRMVPRSIDLVVSLLQETPELDEQQFLTCFLNRLCESNQLVQATTLEGVFDAAVSLRLEIGDRVYKHLVAMRNVVWEVADWDCLDRIKDAFASIMLKSSHDDDGEDGTLFDMAFISGSAISIMDMAEHNAFHLLQCVRSGDRALVRAPAHVALACLGLPLACATPAHRQTWAC